MVLSLLRIAPVVEKWQAVEDILLSTAGPTLAEPGCVRCEVFRGTQDVSVCMIEEWESESALVRHLRSKLYDRVLAAIEFSSKPPEIAFFDVSDQRGLELIQNVRSVA